MEKAISMMCVVVIVAISTFPADAAEPVLSVPNVLGVVAGEAAPQARAFFDDSLNVTSFDDQIETTTLVVDRSGGLPDNGGFERGLEGWKFRPGDDSQVSLINDGSQRGQILELKPNGQLLGVETAPIAMGQQIHSAQAYQVLADLKFTSLDSGVFAFSMYCFDDQGKSLKQISFYPLNPKSSAHDWRRVRGEFGPGTQNPLPEGTQSICIRFSFHEASGNCRGEVAVDNVSLEAYEPPPQNGWPREIIAELGDLEVRFESRSFWTLYRIDYKQTRLGLDRWGSHYGSVVNFPDVGFIGSGHTENEDEQILKLTFWVDGKPVQTPPTTLRCRQLKLQKKSRIRDLLLDTEIEVQDNKIVEDVRLLAEKATPVNLIYHFMHPWTVTATDYLAELPDGSHLEGAFDGNGGHKIDRAVRWSAIYDGPTGKGVVTYVADVPTDDDWRTRYWDLPNRYRKHYLTTFLKSTVPAGKEFHYRVVTIPFEADPALWKEAAARVAESCEND